MLIAVCGGTGMLGRAVVAELVGRGHDVRVLSRSTPPRAASGCAHHPVDLVTGVGLRDALAGVEAIVDAANCAGTGRRAAPVLVGGTRRLLEAGAAEGVAHHVAISIVGIDAVPISYYQVKLAQEGLVANGPIDWSLVRATQFHETLDLVFTTSARCGIVPAMAFSLAPVDPRFLAGVLADAVDTGARGRLAPVAGPRPQPLRELARAWRLARGRRALAVALPLRCAVRRPLAAGALVPQNAIVGGTDFQAWLLQDAQEQAALGPAAGANP